MRLEATADRRVVHQMMPAALDELKTLATDIEKAMEAFDHLYAKASAAIPPWPKKQFEESPGILIERVKPGS
jgi:hypothetical protein